MSTYNSRQVVHLALLICSLFIAQAEAQPTTESMPVLVPVGGNSWLSVLPGRATITEVGLTNWSNPETVIDTYVRVEQTGTLDLSIRLRVPAGKSRIRITIADQPMEVDVQGISSTEYPVGRWLIETPGYVKISLQGISRTGRTFGAVTNFGLGGEVVGKQTAFVRTNDGNFFYWGRRGPSVHLRYPIPEGVEAEWFYNEVTVPKGNDVIGSYYMATGFGEGYFGMQVNSATEHRILFSVWSPFQTDDPKQIPDEQKIQLDRKGAGVVTNDFGNEGAGGQSFLRYNWQAGITYKFLLHASPGTDGYTTFTAYFRASATENWQVIASFKRPKTTTYLKSLYSFLENFIPETGNQQREVNFGNQWIFTKNGQWQELTKIQFTGDNTAKKAYRMDYAGGVTSNGQFFLRNCGFFNDNTPLGTSFSRPARNTPPTIDFNELP